MRRGVKQLTMSLDWCGYLVADELACFSGHDRPIRGPHPKCGSDALL